MDETMLGYMPETDMLLAWGDDKPAVLPSRWRETARMVAWCLLPALAVAGIILAAGQMKQPDKAVTATTTTVTVTPQPPEGKDEAFLAAIQRHGIPLASKSAAIQDGHIQCENLAEYHLAWKDQIDLIVEADPGLTREQATQFLVLARDYYCPDAT